MSDILTRASAAAVMELAARVTVNEGGISRVRPTTLLAVSLVWRVLVRKYFEGVDLVEIRRRDDARKTARWLVKTQVGDLVGGIGLYNDGNSVRLTIAADRFVVLPPGFLNDNDARVPFAVVGGQVYMDDAIIRDASIGTAKIVNGFLTNLAAVHGTIQFARITKGDIFDLTINNIIQSINYVPGSTGWAILRDGSFEVNGGVFRSTIRSGNFVQGSAGWIIRRDGSAEFDAGVIRGTLSAEHIDSDVQNVVVLWESASGVQLSLTAKTFSLSEDLDNFTYITGVAKARNIEYYGPWSIPVSRLSTSSYRQALAPSGIPSNDMVEFDIRRSGTSGLQIKASHQDAFVHIYDVIGVKNPGGTFPDPDPDPDPVTQVPGTPSTPSVVAMEQNSLELSTTPGGGGAATLYRWRYSTNNNVTDSDPMVTSTGPSVTISALAEDTDYWIDVRAENSEGDSAYSADLATSTIEAQTQAPGTPSTPTRTGRTSTSLTLATTAGSGGTPTTYRWRISLNSTVSDSDPMHTSTGPSITITGLNEDDDYWIDVQGRKQRGGQRLLWQSGDEHASRDGDPYAGRS